MDPMELAHSSVFTGIPSSIRDRLAKQRMARANGDAEKQQIRLSTAHIFFRQMSIPALAKRMLFQLLYTLMRHFDNLNDQTDKDTESIFSSDHRSRID
jgi:hypothetical protein